MNATVIDRLSEAIERLTPRAEEKPEWARGLVAAQRIKETVSRPPRVALAGEFSAGKSSVANLLVGASVIPTRVLATPLPTTHLWYGPRPSARVTMADGERIDVDIESLSDRDFIDAQLLEVRLPLPVLRSFELLDTPGLADPQRAFDQMEAMVKRAHLAIWCTNATQAWRETERRKWAAMPERLRRDSLLLITHADLMRNQRDIDKVLKRVQEQSVDMFQRVIPISVLDAMHSRSDDGRIVDTDQWHESGGMSFLDSLEAGVAAVAAKRQAAAAKSFERLVVPILIEVRESRPIRPKPFLVKSAPERPEPVPDRRPVVREIPSLLREDPVPPRPEPQPFMESPLMFRDDSFLRPNDPDAPQETAAPSQDMPDLRPADDHEAAFDASHPGATAPAPASDAAAFEAVVPLKSALLRRETPVAPPANMFLTGEPGWAEVDAAPEPFATPEPVAPPEPEPVPPPVVEAPWVPTPLPIQPVLEEGPPPADEPEIVRAFSDMVEALVAKAGSDNSSAVAAVAYEAVEGVRRFAENEIGPWLTGAGSDDLETLQMFELSVDEVLGPQHRRDAEEIRERLRGILYQLEAELLEMVKEVGEQDL